MTRTNKSTDTPPASQVAQGDDRHTLDLERTLAELDPWRKKRDQLREMVGELKARKDWSGKTRRYQLDVSGDDPSVAWVTLDHRADVARIDFSADVAYMLDEDISAYSDLASTLEYMFRLTVMQ